MFSEGKRKLLHIFYGCFFIVLLWLYPVFAPWFFLGLSVLGLFLSVLQKTFRFKTLEMILAPFERPENIKEFPGKGPLFFSLGSMFAAFLFSKDIALASIAILTFGDSISHLVGSYILHKQKKISRLKKAIEGTLIGIIAAWLSASLFVDPFLAIITAFIVMVAEFLEEIFIGVDDNLYVPLLAGLILMVLQRFLF